MLSGELGVSQAFLACWYIDGGYMDAFEVVIFTIVQNVHPEQVSLAYLVENLLALVKLCCR